MRKILFVEILYGTQHLYATVNLVRHVSIAHGETVHSTIWKSVIHI